MNCGEKWYFAREPSFGNTSQRNPRSGIARYPDFQTIQATRDHTFPGERGRGCERPGPPRLDRQNGYRSCEHLPQPNFKLGWKVCYCKKHTTVVK